MILAVGGFVHKSVCVVPDGIRIFSNRLVPDDVKDACAVQLPAEGTRFSFFSDVGIIIFIVEEAVCECSGSLSHSFIGGPAVYKFALSSLATDASSLGMGSGEKYVSCREAVLDCSAVHLPSKHATADGSILENRSIHHTKVHYSAR